MDLDFSKGIFSNCSANEYVLRAVMRRAKAHGLPALIEATANQVNQFGGYTGMKPADFVAYVHDIAKSEEFDASQLILGGDHLGPLTWCNIPGISEQEAMKNAEQLIHDYVAAGFTKIHIDTSMRLDSDDKNAPLTDEIIAERGARLCAVAESLGKKPIYIIGSEVPIPGGATEAEDGLHVTRPQDCTATINAFKSAFDKLGLSNAWERVVGVVVQPGVEFGEDDVFVYDRKKAADLCKTIKGDRLVFEGHSTDYQPKQALREMVEDGITILKVGPALTFALREALFALENIEKVMLRGRGIILSNFADTLETTMLEKPGNWNKHYHGDGFKQRINRAYGFSDRARYYLPEPAVQQSITRLIENLKDGAPLPLLSQFMPIQYLRVRDGEVKNTAQDLILDRIGDCIDDYIFAIMPS